MMHLTYCNAYICILLQKLFPCWFIYTQKQITQIYLLQQYFKLPTNIIVRSPFHKFGAVYLDLFPVFFLRKCVCLPGLWDLHVNVGTCNYFKCNIFWQISLLRGWGIICSSRIANIIDLPFIIFNCILCGAYT